MTSQTEIRSALEAAPSVGSLPRPTAKQIDYLAALFVRRAAKNAQGAGYVDFSLRQIASQGLTLRGASNYINELKV